MSAKHVLWLMAGLALAGCVAPEQPAPVRRAPSADLSAAPPRTGLEDAPIPNRSLRGPSDSNIRIQR